MVGILDGLTFLCNLALKQGQAGISYEGPDFAGLTAAISVTQFCHCGAKATVDNTQMNACGCVPKKHYFQV